MSIPPPPDEQDSPDNSQEGARHSDPKLHKKITAKLKRVVPASAMGRSLPQIAEQEGVAVNSIKKRKDRINKLLSVQTLHAAYRLLLLWDIMPLE